MENDDLEPAITLEQTLDDDGNVDGYEATYQDAGREYVIEYDENFNYEGETVTKLTMISLLSKRVRLLSKPLGGLSRMIWQELQMAHINICFRGR